MSENLSAIAAQAARERAEKYTREILSVTWRNTHQDASGEIWQDALKSSIAVQAIILRVIEESRQPE